MLPLLRVILYRVFRNFFPGCSISGNGMPPGEVVFLGIETIHIQAQNRWHLSQLQSFFQDKNVIKLVPL